MCSPVLVTDPDGRAPTCRYALFADINRPSFWRVDR